MNDKRPSICIVGAGLSGLVSARDLAKAGFAVQVVEQHSTAGGMLSSMRLGHEYIEPIPHHIRKSDKNLLSLLKDLGLYEGISWFDSYWYGRAGKKKLGYPESGFHSLVSALTQEIADFGGLIHYGYTAMDICKIADPLSTNSPKHSFSISCVLADCTTVSIEADYVLFTASCRNFAHITHNLLIPTDYRDALMDITYRANICLMLLTKSQLSGCFSRPVSISAPFQRIIEHTNLVGERKYGGHVLYLSGSFSTTSPMWTQSDDAVYKDFLRHLQLISPAIGRNDIITWRLTRTRYATPLTLPSSSLLSPLPGLYLTTLEMNAVSDQTESEFRMDTCIYAAHKAAREILGSENDDSAEAVCSSTIEHIY